MVWASVFIVLLVGCVFFYNQLAKLDALADEAWKEALNRFERRYGLLASLADTAAGKTQRTEELCSRARRCAEIDTDIKQRQNAENRKSYTRAALRPGGAAHFRLLLPGQCTRFCLRYSVLLRRYRRPPRRRHSAP